MHVLRPLLLAVVPDQALQRLQHSPGWPHSGRYLHLAPVLGLRGLDGLRALQGASHRHTATFSAFPPLCVRASHQSRSNLLTTPQPYYTEGILRRKAVVHVLHGDHRQRPRSHRRRPHRLVRCRPLRLRCPLHGAFRPNHFITQKIESHSSDSERQSDLGRPWLPGRGDPDRGLDLVRELRRCVHQRLSDLHQRRHHPQKRYASE